MNLIFSSDEGVWSGGGEADGLILLFFGLECLNCWQVDGCGVRLKVLFRIFRVPGFIQAYCFSWIPECEGSTTSASFYG